MSMTCGSLLCGSYVVSLRLLAGAYPFCQVFAPWQFTRIDTLWVKDPEEEGASTAGFLLEGTNVVVVCCQIASVEEAVARSAPASPLRSGPDQASNGSRLAAGSQQQHQQPHRPLFPGGTRVAPQPSQQSTFASFPSSFPTGQSQNAPGAGSYLPSTSLHPCLPNFSAQFRRL
jgi:hypothetical protein